MSRSVITSMRTVRDAIDRFEWEVRVTTDFFGSRHQLAYGLHWEGRVAFYRESHPAGSMPGPNHPVLTLPARWTNREKSARMVVPNEMLFGFASELPATALDRIEQFREGGRLFVRIEGSLFVVCDEGDHPGRNSINEMLVALGTMMVTPGYLSATPVCSDPKELSRDTWCEEVLAKLRPEGRHLLEVTVRIGAPAGDLAMAALRHQSVAQRAFDEAAYEQVVQSCARALEPTVALLEAAEVRYGKLRCDQIAEQCKAMSSLCDQSTPGGKSNQARLAVDRALAQHVLISTSSLLALVAK